MNSEGPSVMQRVIVTGSSGYLGSKIVADLRNRGAIVLGVDVRPSAEATPDEFIQSDICDQSLANRFQEFAPDTVIHAAFVLKPLQDETQMRRINVDGTRNVMAAISKLSVARFMVFSSATVYGAWADNPVPMDESCPIRVRPKFLYAADKVEVERLIDEFSKGHPEIAVSCVRPVVVGGPGMDNYLRKNIFALPFVLRFDRRDVPVQFVHEDDVVSAIGAILVANGRGIYNIAPPDWMLTSDFARETRRRVVTLPFWLVECFATLGWKARLRQFDTPPGYLHYVRFPWVVNPKRLCSELGFQFRYSSVETLRAMIGRPNAQKP